MRGKKFSKHVKFSVKDRTILICGHILPTTPLLIAKAILKIAIANERKKIRVFISSSGGDFHASLQIYQFFAHLPVKLETVACDEVASGALLILQGGKKRFAFTNSKLRFHEAVLDLTDGSYSTKKIKEMISEIDLVNAAQLLILTARGMPVSSIFNSFKHEDMLTAEDALKLHLIDGIIKDKF
ncbi:ATP-dependent Clp protease proteolytic subunit [Candidatus Giovannonibacteria bacterium]|nr:ATP-dependent Clp protease proteolytic subunit [Candidatus Giovannonibacteria bacterium]